MLSDLRESGAIEQDSDIVFSLYRSSYYLDKCDDMETFKNQETIVEGQGEINCLKNRNGRTGMTYFYHNESFTKITDFN